LTRYAGVDARVAPVIYRAVRVAHQRFFLCDVGSLCVARFGSAKFPNPRREPRPITSITGSIGGGGLHGETSRPTAPSRYAHCPESEG